MGSTLAEVQIDISLVDVPESSPRATKTVLPAWPAAAIFLNASAAVSTPLMPAGSDAGPTMTNSLYMTSVRAPPKPAATNFFSAAGLWTSRTSASFFSPSLMASPEPTATTLTLYVGLSFSNAGMSTENSPESCVDVVDARIISVVFGASRGRCRAGAPAVTSRPRGAVPRRGRGRRPPERAATSRGDAYDAPFHREAGPFPASTLSVQGPWPSLAGIGCRCPGLGTCMAAVFRGCPRG